jgi:hypothetical protein
VILASAKYISTERGLHSKHCASLHVRLVSVEVKSSSLVCNSQR